jgi:anti-sigma B factor antagonist
MNLELSTTPVGQRAVVTVAGEVDLETASQLSDHALAALRDVSPHVVLDVSGVTFMDSTGLKVMISIARRTEAAHGSFAVVGASRTVLRLLSLTGLDEAFPLYATLADVDTDQPGSPSS